MGMSGCVKPRNWQAICTVAFGAFPRRGPESCALTLVFYLLYSVDGIQKPATSSQLLGFLCQGPN